MEIGMAKVISGLTDSKMHHSIACLKGEAEIKHLLPGETKIYQFFAKPNEIGLPIRLAKLLCQIKPDIIHARNWGAWPDIAMSRILCPRKIPLILSFHGLGKAGYMPMRRRIASKLLVYCSDILMTVSNQSRDMLVEKWFWPEKKIWVIPNGVDTNKFFPKIKKQNKKIIIGSVGNLRTVKNHALILKACSKFNLDEQDFEIRIAGEGSQRESLLNMAYDLDIQNRLKLYGRVENIPGFLSELDIFVLSSDSEQHPNALNEAMACGIASISTNVGCVRDLLDNGNCGIIIEPGREDQLYTALKELIDDQNKRIQLSKNGYQQVLKNYSLDIMLKNYRAMYLSVA